MPWRLDLLLLLAIVLPSEITSLTCYICGDTNLDEFGECSTQFQYDCGSYAARFGPEERIYCRTTRHKAVNNTYTIMKECISEQDHYRTFPEKGYRLDEECDLVEVNKQEVAYCLCRSDMCNKNPVAEQFMSFEEKHPELFGDAEESAEKKPVPVTGPAPLKIGPLPGLPNPNLVAAGSFAGSNAFAAPMLQPAAIVPVNAPRGSNEQLQENRRPQLPTRTLDTSTETVRQPVKDASPTEFIPISKPAVSQGSFVASSHQIPINPIVNHHSSQASESESTSSESSHMQCIQCGDGNLHSTSEDCKKPTQVECESERSMCFTRQITLGNGMFAVEKMCILPEQLVGEFGEKAKDDGCGSSNGGRVQYCACSSPLCNHFSISQQKKILKSIEPAAGHRLPDLAQPELPVQRPALIPRQPQFPPNIITAPEVPPVPIVPVVVKPDTDMTMRCMGCSEGDMADPTADCSRNMPIDCTPPTGEPAWCMTKQTQISSAAFALEKRCISETQLRTFLPGEKFVEGCSTSQGGMVNFCLCSGPLCNKESLLQQAQMAGVRDSLEQQRQVEEEEKKKTFASNTFSKKVNVEGPSFRTPSPILENDDARNSLEHKIEKDIRTEEDIVRERQKEWAKADPKSSSNLLFTALTLILTVFLSFLL